MKRKLSSIFLLAFALICSATAAVAQQQQQQGGISSVGNITRPGSFADQGYGTFMSNLNQGAISGGLAGKVVVQGHPLLWEPIVVLLSCSPEKPDMTVPTDPSGNYFIDHANLPKVYTTDKDAVNIQLSQHYEGCTLHAPLAGYHSTSVRITEKNLRDKPVMDDIVLTTDERASGTAFSTVGTSDSPEGARLFDKAHDEWLHGHTDAARSDLEHAVKLSPHFAQAWYYLGRIQMASNLSEGAASLMRAHEADPKFVPPCIYLGQIAMGKRDWTGAEKWTNQALTLYPAGTPLLWYVNGQAHYHLGHNEAAVHAAQKAVALDPEHNLQNAEDLLALTLVARHDYQQALVHLRNSLNYILSGPSADLIKRQIAFVEQQSAAEKK